MPAWSDSCRYRRYAVGLRRQNNGIDVVVKVFAAGCRS
jgi:hypothetical protein